ncbi:hypothetical protein Trydic_g3382 [Trypoxylus dichotomus]
MDIPDGLETVLEQVTPNFEENLKRAFINEGIRIQSMSGWKSHSLDDVLDTIDNNIVELRNLKLTRTPDFRVNNFSVDLAMLTLNLGLSLGQLKVEGEYEVANKALQRILPISQVGKIVIILENVSCDGRAGIYIKEDSFVVENYDLTYRPSEISIRVSYFKEQGVEVDNEIAESDIERNQIIKAFWVQFTDVLTSLLHRQLGAVIVEYSVNELLLDEGEPDQLRDLARQRALTANRLLDSLLCATKTHLVETGQRILEGDQLRVVFKSRPPGTQQGSLETDVAEILDMATLSRITEMSILEEKESLIIYGQIMLREFKYNYDHYKAEYGDSISQGSLKTTIYKNKISVKLLIEKVNNNNCKVKLETLQFQTVSDIDIDISGLGSLSWLRDRVRSWAIGHLHNKILPSIEDKIKSAFNYAIDITNCGDILKLNSK